MKFYGEYFNRNRRGKEYHDNGKIKFECEYLGNDKNWLCKEYYENGNLKFDGEYINGIKWNGKIYNSEKNESIYELKNGSGYVKEYDDKGKLEFEGKYLYGKKE